MESSLFGSISSSYGNSGGGNIMRGGSTGSAGSASNMPGIRTASPGISSTAAITGIATSAEDAKASGSLISNISVNSQASTPADSSFDLHALPNILLPPTGSSAPISITKQQTQP